jgi:hypothetical protein
VLLDGPVFADELAGTPQQLQEFRATHGLDQRRLVPAKSAASGVHSVYFRPEHREWALVRLAKRYRWAVEIQLLRGMSGERQLLRTGFTADDVGFLADIVPEPPAAYSPVVYDVLWLAATTEAYVRLARAVRERGQFRPRDILRETEGLDLDDVNCLTRFLRSHLVRESVTRPPSTTRGSNPESGELAVDLDSQYEVTPEGRASLDGIVEEYDRILVSGAFDPLLVDPDRDPERHLEGAPTADSAGDHERVATVEADGERGSLSGDGGSVAEPDTGDGDTTTDQEDTLVGEYSEAEIEAGVRAAQELVAAENVVRSAAVKEAVWGAVDRGDRSKAQLWETVVDVLLASDAVNGRPGGRVWTARTYTRVE